MVIAINPHKQLGDQGHAACGARADLLQIFPVTHACDMGTLVFSVTRVCDMGTPIFPVTRVCDMGTPLPSPVFMTWGPLCRQHVDNNGLHVHRVRVPIVFEIWKKHTCQLQGL